MKKKFITTLTMSVLLAFGTFSTPLAATVSGSKDVAPPMNNSTETGFVDLSADVQSSYIVNIPELIDFGTLQKSDATDPDRYDLAGINLELTENFGFNSVSVTLADYNTLLYRNANPDDASISYSVEDVYGIPVNGYGALVSQLDNTNKSDTCWIKVDKSSITKGGHYSGAVFFTFTGEETI